MKFTKDIPLGKKGFQKLPSKLLLKGARLIDPSLNLDKNLDILIINGKIKAVDKIDLMGFDGQVFDCSGKIASPGWMDMHVHLREPGREDEETIEYGSLAAANGGFTAICCTPDTTPAIDSQEIILYIKEHSNGSLVDVHPIAAITKNRQGHELAEILDLVEQGAVAISDNNAPVMNSEIMRRALEYSRMVNIPVIAYEEDSNLTGEGQMNEGFMSTCLGLSGIPTVAENIMIARDILLTEFCGGKLHIANVTTQKGVDLIRKAKKQEISITAEVTPHHFTLTDEVVANFDTNTKVKPPLRSKSDLVALIDGLKDGTIDTIVSGHAPHSWEEKAAEFIYAPFGIVGLETALGLSITQLVNKNIIGLSAIIEKFAINPYKILGLKIPSIQKNKMANITLFDVDTNWAFLKENSLSKSLNSPFIDTSFKGKPHTVINNNQFFNSIL